MKFNRDVRDFWVYHIGFACAVLVLGVAVLEAIFLILVH